MSNPETTAGDHSRPSPGPQPLLLAFGFLVLMLISVASVWLVDRSHDDADMVVHTLEVQNRLSLILLNLRRAESAHRGYLVTGQDFYRSEYERAASNTAPAIDRAREAVQDNPAQLRMLAIVQPLVRDKLAEMERVVTLYDRGGAAEAYAQLRAGEGRDLMEEIRTHILDALNAERSLLDARRTESAATNRNLLAANLAGTALVFLIGAISIYLVQRTSRQREQARRALQETNENLETTIAERTADLREANSEIQRFAYIVSHDLRSPLVNVMGFTAELESIKKDIFDTLEAMQKTDTETARKTLELSRDFDESLDFIKSSIGKMDRLINSILKLSREGQRTFKPEYVSMDQLIKTITQAVAHQAAEGGVEIAAEALPPIKSDRLALEQIFSNLVDNALKYTQPGRAGHIRIRGRSDNAHVIFEVEDNGRGIAPNDHQRVFDLFRRAGQQDQKGEGIGLAHVRALVRRLGGFIALKSELGKGSTFTVTLPRRMQEDETRRMSQHVTIVMIEDDDGHARLIERNIRRAGVNNEILPFGTGTEAVRFLFGPDGSGSANRGRALLVLLDLNLPDMSGIDILKRVKENEHLKLTPVVVLTTTDDEREIKRCYDLGANVYITKPVNYDSFANAIRQLGLFFSVIQVPATT